MLSKLKLLRHKFGITPSYYSTSMFNIFMFRKRNKDYLFGNQLDNLLFAFTILFSGHY